MLRLIKEALGDWCLCEFSSTVADGREKLAHEPFHIALCCIETTNESHLTQVGEIIRSHPDTGVMVITGEYSLRVAERTFGLGAHGYLVEPFWPGQLLIATMNALRRRELEMAERARTRVLLASAEKRADHFRDEMFRAQQKSIDDILASRRETVERLSVAIEMHDAETGHHVTRMASISAFLGMKLGLDSEAVELLRDGAPMHDVGKIATPDHVLNKAGPLSGKERDQIEEHTTIGYQILADSPSDLLRMAATIALTHHERWDGTGYPMGLEGEKIPFEGRIAAVADTFDALLSDRSYRPALSTEDAIALIAAERGTHFDPRVVDIFLDHIEELVQIRDRSPAQPVMSTRTPGVIRAAGH